MGIGFGKTRRADGTARQPDREVNHTPAGVDIELITQRVRLPADINLCACSVGPEERSGSHFERRQHASQAGRSFFTNRAQAGIEPDAKHRDRIDDVHDRSVALIIFVDDDVAG